MLGALSSRSEALDSVSTQFSEREFQDAGIRTSDRLRTLMQMNGYGNDPAAAFQMEKIIAHGRDAVTAGSISNSQSLERFVAENYIKGVLGKPKIEDRIYEEASLMPKHRPYAKRISDLLLGRSEVDLGAKIDGRYVNFASLLKEWHGIGWKLPTEQHVMELGTQRVNKLFENMMNARGESPSDALLDHHLRIASESDWLNGNMWKYDVGSAGVSQLQTRIWLELAGIDSGRYKVGIDPNLEALTKPLADFQNDYPHMFERRPSFY